MNFNSQTLRNADNNKIGTVKQLTIANKNN
jgi:hypothetical protein